MRCPVVVLTAALLLGCGAPSPSPAAAPSEEAVQAELVQVLDHWYGAMERADSAGTISPLTDRFLLLEDTLPLSGAELAREIAHPLPGSRPWRSARTGYRTRVQGDVAWTTFDNHETQLDPSGAPVCSADFIETVVFVHQSRWLIDRYHAAARRRWSC
jgi:hypothetical protein